MANRVNSALMRCEISTDPLITGTIGEKEA